jgi:cytochrome P450
MRSYYERSGWGLAREFRCDCPGLSVARINLQIALEELVRRLDQLALAPHANGPHALTQSVRCLP